MMRLLVGGVLFCFCCSGPGRAQVIRFGVIGDYGSGSQAEADVARLVTGWGPDFILTTGDNNYPLGEAATIDANIGQFYHAYIQPYTGAYGTGASQNRFFPVLGNHDWYTANAQPYKDYFNLPGNERYYDFTRGPVHFFALDSDPNEPDGISASSVQGTWLKNGLAAATEPWKVVFMHRPPFSSGNVHGSAPELQWPFQDWGASVVLAGHDHTYERINQDGMLYFVNGVGGSSLYSLGTTVAGSQFSSSIDYGAMLVTASLESITYEFFTRDGALIDSFTAVPEPIHGVATVACLLAVFGLGQRFRSTLLGA